jgi:hypothetical protein
MYDSRKWLGRDQITRFNTRQGPLCASRPALGTAQPRFQWPTWAYPLTVKWSGSEGDQFTCTSWRLLESRTVYVMVLTVHKFSQILSLCILRRMTPNMDLRILISVTWPCNTYYYYYYYYYYLLRSIRDFSTFSVHRNFKASPSARCVSVANTVCWNTDIFNKDDILLMHISYVFTCDLLLFVLFLLINYFN